MFQQVTILGPGLLGASLAMAIKENSLAQKIVIWDQNKASRTKCKNQEWCDYISETPEAAVKNSDLVLICTPVQTIISILQQIQPTLAKNALVTDIGSTKASICDAAQKIFENSQATFIGSHPMTGSEKTGMDHARPNLFENAACILTPSPSTPDSTIDRIRVFWTSLKMNISITSPEVHDRIVAHVSHLPHVLASALCAYLSTKDHNWMHLAGGGLHDTTRIAAGNPELWVHILEQNRDELLKSINGFQSQLDRLKTLLKDNNCTEIKSLLEQGKVYRDQF